MSFSYLEYREFSALSPFPLSHSRTHDISLRIGSPAKSFLCMGESTFLAGGNNTRRTGHQLMERCKCDACYCLGDFIALTAHQGVYCVDSRLNGRMGLGGTPLVSRHQSHRK